MKKRKVENYDTALGINKIILKIIIYHHTGKHFDNNVSGMNNATTAVVL